jgi:hypothetical protein
LLIFAVLAALRETLFNQEEISRKGAKAANEEKKEIQNDLDDGFVDEMLRKSFFYKNVVIKQDKVRNFHINNRLPVPLTLGTNPGQAGQMIPDFVLTSLSTTFTRKLCPVSGK